MIRRRPPRHRGQHQDFHFFAAGDPIANIESQFARPAQPSLVQSAGPAEPEPAASVNETAPAAQTSAKPLTAAASSAIRQSIEFLAKIDDPRELIGLPRPIFMGELDALAASRPKASANRGKRRPASSRARKRKRAPACRARRPSQSTLTTLATGASHHERHCVICSHPDRAEIEADFIHWESPNDIAEEYDVSRASVYRHARAAGLFARRKRNLSIALGHMIEHVQHVFPTPDSIVRAIHALARINDQGEWVEPPAHVVVSSGGVRRDAAAPPSRRPISLPLDSPVLANVIDVSADPALPAASATPTRDSQLPETVFRVETDATC